MILVDGIICVLIFLRVLLFRRAGAVHRPLAAVLAYLIAISSGTEALRAALGVLPPPGIATVALHTVLLLSLLASRGNVVELFHTSEAENCIYRIIRRTRHVRQ